MRTVPARDRHAASGKGGRISLPGNGKNPEESGALSGAIGCAGSSGKAMGVRRRARDRMRACFAPQDIIYRENDQAERIYRVRSGLVKLLSYLPCGRARIVRLHARNHWIGLAGLMGRDHVHTAVAVGEVEVELIPLYRMQRLRRENPGALVQLLYQWHGDLLQADKWIAEFSTGAIHTRVARLLEYLAVLEYGPSADRVGLLNVCEMAEILGVTLESVSRVIAGFKRDLVLQKLACPSRELYRIDRGRLRQGGGAYPDSAVRNAERRCDVCNG